MYLPRMRNWNVKVAVVELYKSFRNISDKFSMVAPKSGRAEGGVLPAHTEIFTVKVLVVMAKVQRKFPEAHSLLQTATLSYKQRFPEAHSLSWRKYKTLPTTPASSHNVEETESRTTPIRLLLNVVELQLRGDALSSSSEKQSSRRRGSEI